MAGNFHSQSTIGTAIGFALRPTVFTQNPLFVPTERSFTLVRLSVCFENANISIKHFKAKLPSVA